MLVTHIVMMQKQMRIKPKRNEVSNSYIGILPEDQFNEYMELWQEFEKKETKEAVFAAVLDRVQPIMLNYATDGRAWKEHGIHHEQVLERNKITLEKAPEEFVIYLKEIIDSAVEKGYLK